MASPCCQLLAPPQPSEALISKVWARQHHRQRDPPFVPRKRLPDWASLEPGRLSTFQSLIGPDQAADRC